MTRQWGCLGESGVRLGRGDAVAAIGHVTSGAAGGGWRGLLEAETGGRVGVRGGLRSILNPGGGGGIALAPIGSAGPGGRAGTGMCGRVAVGRSVEPDPAGADAGRATSCRVRSRASAAAAPTAPSLCHLLAVPSRIRDRHSQPPAAASTPTRAPNARTIFRTSQMPSMVSQKGHVRRTGGALRGGIIA